MIKIGDFLLSEMVELYPATEKLLTEELFIEFYEKYCIMYRENVFRGLKNLTRQRRSYNRYFEDIGILTGEANFTDDALLKKSNKSMNFENTTCLIMTINLFLSTQRQFLKKGFLLELLCANDLPEHFYYMMQVYDMFAVNRQ